MLLALKFDPKAAFAFVMATGFIADTTSLPLGVSNLVNIVSADFFGIGFGRYALVMIPVSLASLAASLLVLRVYFRKAITGRYDVADLARPADVVHDHLTFRAGWVVVTVLLVGYFVADPLGVPIAAVAGLGAIAIVLIAARKPAWAFARISPALLAVDVVGVVEPAHDHARSGAVHEDIHDHALDPGAAHHDNREARRPHPDRARAALGPLAGRPVQPWDVPGRLRSAQPRPERLPR